MTVPVDPVSNPQEWDQVQIAGVTYYGVVVSGFKREHKWDVKEGKGAFGATTSFVNEPPSKGQVEFWAWLPSQFAAFDNILRQLKYDPAKKRTNAVDIHHPATIDIDVKSVVGTEIGIWEHAGNQFYKRTVQFLKFKPPPKTSAVATPTSSTANDPSATEGVPVNPAVQAAQDELDSALKDAQALGPL